jgi:hypothetical protein
LKRLEWANWTLILDLNSSSLSWGYRKKSQACKQFAVWVSQYWSFNSKCSSVYAICTQVSTCSCSDRCRSAEFNKSTILGVSWTTDEKVVDLPCHPTLWLFRTVFIISAVHFTTRLIKALLIVHPHRSRNLGQTHCHTSHHQFLICD